MSSSFTNKKDLIVYIIIIVLLLSSLLMIYLWVLDTNKELYYHEHFAKNKKNTKAKLTKNSNDDLVVSFYNEFLKKNVSIEVVLYSEKASSLKYVSEVNIEYNDKYPYYIYYKDFYYEGSFAGFIVSNLFFLIPLFIFLSGIIYYLLKLVYWK